MTTNQKTKIHNLESLLVEKKRLQGLCRASESRMEDRLDYIRKNYIELSIDHIFLPALKKTFNLRNLLQILNLKSLNTFLFDKDTGKNTVINDLSGLFGKTGWMLAFKLGVALVKKFFK